MGVVAEVEAGPAAAGAGTRAGGGGGALVAAAVALAAARVTAKGMLGLVGEGSHLDLFEGLAVSPSSSVCCRVLLLLKLLPALTLFLGNVAAPSAVAAVAPIVPVVVGSVTTSATAASACLPATPAASSPCMAAPTTTETPGRFVVSI